MKLVIVLLAMFEVMQSAVALAVAFVALLLLVLAAGLAVRTLTRPMGVK